MNRTNAQTQKQARFLGSGVASDAPELGLDRSSG